MSKLIEALNRLQSVRTEEGLPSSHSLLTDSRPDKPESVQQHRPDTKPSSKNNRHSEESPRFNLALGEWLGILHHEYLGSFVREGGGAVKFAVFPSEDGLKTCQQELEGMAKREGYVLAKVDARFTKAHMIERLFQKIAKQIDWDELAYRFLQRLLEEHGHQIPSDRQEFSLRQIAMVNERKEPMLRRDIQTWMEKAIEGDSGLCREFRMAMIRLCMAQLDAGDSDRVLASAVKEWLCGDLRLVSGVKKALIYQKISRHNARYMLSSLTRWLRLTGQGGLILSLDISRYLMKKDGLPNDGSLSFSPSATIDLYELLRQFIDSADEMEGLLMVVLAPQEFLTDSRRGVDRYEALKLRVWDDVRPKHRQNPLASLVRIHNHHQQVSEEEHAASTATPRRMVPDGEARRVIEGLRAGVPNRHVVTTLGCLQPEVEGRFRRLLEATQQNITAGSCPRGMVIEGAFGSGKSHILEYLQNLALDANFICSRIVISKETPLYHPVRLYYSAIEAAVIPDKRGEVFSEIAGQCDVWAPRYKNLVTWVNDPESQIDARFAATLMLYERLSSDMELGHRMTRFWTGDPIGVGDLKKYLQEAGFGERYAFGKISAAELALQRFQFAARLMQAAGYAGWILLIDEAELIGRYSVNQRAKSYAEVARLMNLDGGPTLPGLGAVLALTNDFREEVLEKKGDKIKLLEKLRAKHTEAERLLADKAEKGMGLLETQRIPLGQPPNDIIQESYQTIRSLHLKGHGWHMWENAANDPAQIIPGTSMRKYVKSWVTHWDSLRFYPGEACEIEASPWKPSCVEQENAQKANAEEDNQQKSHGGRFAVEADSMMAEKSGEQEFVAPGTPNTSGSFTNGPKTAF
ncbi:BREX system ATP-binding domain-containing protein [Nitrospira sp. T9]|uniref:BREX system ATP-binding domain-containing protein n=1 Tax=unclassified Nitrospira TaxID=2652172 RepID=UPI003F9AF97B